jgi:hypothetical protein
MIKKLGICGDSFMLNLPPDNIHWTSQLNHLDRSISQINLSAGGASNITIASQVRNAVNYNCDSIVVGFTEFARFEFDQNSNQHINCTTPSGTVSDCENRWRRSPAADLIDKEPKFRSLYHGMMSHDWLALQSYYVILSTLHFLTNSKINFAYSLGGFVIPDNFFNKFCIPNELLQFESNMLTINLWKYPGKKVLTGFHVYDQLYQRSFLDDTIRTLNQHDR